MSVEHAELHCETLRPRHRARAALRRPPAGVDALHPVRHPPRGVAARAAAGVRPRPRAAHRQQAATDVAPGPARPVGLPDLPAGRGAAAAGQVLARAARGVAPALAASGGPSRRRTRAGRRCRGRGPGGPATVTARGRRVVRARSQSTILARSSGGGRSPAPRPRGISTGATTMPSRSRSIVPSIRSSRAVLTVSVTGRYAATARSGGPAATSRSSSAGASGQSASWTRSARASRPSHHCATDTGR